MCLERGEKREMVELILDLKQLCCPWCRARVTPVYTPRANPLLALWTVQWVALGVLAKLGLVLEQAVCNQQLPHCFVPGVRCDATSREALLARGVFCLTMSQSPLDGVHGKLQPQGKKRKLWQWKTPTPLFWLC